MAKRDYQHEGDSLEKQWDDRRYVAFLQGVRDSPHYSITDILIQRTRYLTTHRNPRIREEAKETLLIIG